MRALRARLRAGTVFSLMAAGVLAVTTASAPAMATTLEEALSEAYTSNPQLLAERARQRATDELVSQAVSGWRPSVTVQGTYGKTDTDTTIPPAATTTTELEPWTASVTATQPIFQGGRVLAQTRQARAQVRAGRAQLAAVEQQVLLGAVTAYMDVVRDEAVVELSEGQVAVLKRQLQAVRDRFEVGEIARTDVAQAEARLSRSQSALTAAQAQLTLSRSAYERIMGQTPEGLERAPAAPSVPDSEDSAIEAGRSANPLLAAAREQESAAEHGIDLAVGGLLPTLSVQAEFQRTEGTATSDSETERTSVQGVLTVPLYQGGEEYSRVRQARATRSQQQLLVSQTAREVDESVKNAWDGLRSARASIESDREQVRANEIALEGVRQESDVGLRTTLDVLDAEQELLDSRVALVRSQRNEIVAAFSLLAATGGLNAQGLKLPVDIYDPSVNFDDVSGQWIGFGSD